MSLAPVPSLAGRVARLRAALVEASLDALLVSHLPNLFYLTNISASAGLLLVTASRLYLITDFRYSAAVAALLADGRTWPELDIVSAGGSYEEALVDILVGGGPARLGVEGAHLPVARFEWLRETLERRSWTGSLRAVDRLVERGRRTKDAHELALFREAGAKLSDVTRDVLADVVAAGRSELEIAADIDWRVRRAGFSKPAFDTIVASGPQSALPHARPTSRRLRRGDLVVVDFGGVFEGYCVDVTRTVAVGEASTEVRRLHAAVREAQAAAIAAARPGVSVAAVDAAARVVLEGYGLGDAFGHATGHGLGLEVHEEPRIGRPPRTGSADVLEAGVVCTIEPGVYIPGLGGVRIEDDLYVGDAGAALLTDVVRDLVCV
ncbi:MAG: Xaa-Pro peptidase family protein [Vicinamibacterales bacterium]